MPITIHKAKYAYVHPGWLLENAAILVSESGHILQIESGSKPPAASATAIQDWGSAIILPGLINAHAHLELTSLHGQISGSISFTDWILNLIKLRQSWTVREYQASARKGARMALASGTTLVGDIASGDGGWNATDGERLRRVVFEEALTLFPSRVDSVLARLNALYDNADVRPLQIHGISPHAPYSTCAELYQRAAGLAQTRAMPLATHLAETRGELQFLQTADGEFRDFLEKFGAFPDGWKPPASSPVGYLNSLAVLGPSSLLIHCNYLDDASLEQIARSGSSVVYCPRSHAFFGHDKHPIRQLLEAGINVALGTDSLASNDSLSMIEEMRYLFAHRKDLDAGEIFQAATANGASALGFGQKLGHLSPGAVADMAVLGLPQELNSRQLLHKILEGAGECMATIVEGVVAWQKSDSSPQTASE